MYYNLPSPYTRADYVVFPAEKLSMTLGSPAQRMNEYELDHSLVYEYLHIKRNRFCLPVQCTNSRPLKEILLICPWESLFRRCIVYVC